MLILHKAPTVSAFYNNYYQCSLQGLVQQLLPVLTPGPHATIITSAYSRASCNNYYQCSLQGIVQQLLPVLIPEPRATIITSANSRASCSNYYQCSLQGLMQQLLPVLIPWPRATIITSAHSRASCNNYYQCSFKGLVQQLLRVLSPGPVPTFLSDGLFLCLGNEEAVNELRDNLLRLKIRTAETKTTYEENRRKTSYAPKQKKWVFVVFCKQCTSPMLCQNIFPQNEL